MSDQLKDRTFKALVFVFLMFGSAQMASAKGTAPARDQVAKLVAAVWKEPPASLEAMMYTETIRPPEPEGKIRKEMEDFFFKQYDVNQMYQKYGPNSPALKVMLDRMNSAIDMNVERIMKEQQNPTRTKDWVRISGNRERHDVAHTRTPGVSLGPETPFENTYVTVGKSHREPGFMSFSYEGKLKLATVTDKSGWASNNPVQFANIPLNTCTVLKVLLGRKEGTQAKPVFVPDPNKIERFSRTGVLAGVVRLWIVPDPNAPDTRDRIEIGDPNSSARTVLVCDRDDYSRAYEVRTYGPAGKLIYHRQCGDFDAHGFPHKVIETKYDRDGSLKKKSVYRITELKVNCPIPDEVFEFNPPEGYQVMDVRGQEQKD